MFETSDQEASARMVALIWSSLNRVKPVVPSAPSVPLAPSPTDRNA